MTTTPMPGQSPDVPPADDNLLHHLTRNAPYALRRGTVEPSPALLAALGASMPAVLARLTHTEDRLAHIADNLHPCPTPDLTTGASTCNHGTWPCNITEAAWLARGLDPAEQVTTAMADARTHLAENPPATLGCPVCGAPTRGNMPCINPPAGSPPGTASCTDLADGIEPAVRHATTLIPLGPAMPQDSEPADTGTNGGPA